MGRLSDLLVGDAARQLLAQADIRACLANCRRHTSLASDDEQPDRVRADVDDRGTHAS